MRICRIFVMLFFLAVHLVAAESSCSTTDPSCGRSGTSCGRSDASSGRSDASSGRPDDAVAFGDHWYRVYLEDLTWHQAKRRCEDLGGHLATITSAEEQAFIARLADGVYLYLGACDEAEEDCFVWVTGEGFDYSCWFAGQPNNYDDEDYLATYDGGEWVDVHADGEGFWMPVGFICEWE